MDSELLMALHTQYLKYVSEIAKTTKNLATFLNQNKDFRAAFDVSVILYLRSADIELSIKRQEQCSSPDLQLLSGDKDELVAMCSELRQLIVE